MQTCPPSWQLDCLSQPLQICLALVMKTNSDVFMATSGYLLDSFSCMFVYSLPGKSQNEVEWPFGCKYTLTAIKFVYSKVSSSDVIKCA